MSNKTATLSYSLQYTDEDGKAKTSNSSSVVVPYQGQNVGSVDVPDTTASTTSYDIPFGEVTNAFLVVVDNHTGQDLNIYINAGADPCFLLKDGSRYIAQALTSLTDTPLVTSVTAETTATQDGAGLISYKVLGDPV